MILRVCSALSPNWCSQIIRFILVSSICDILGRIRNPVIKRAFVKLFAEEEMFKRPASLLAFLIILFNGFSAEAQWRSQSDPKNGTGRVELVGPSFLFTYLCSKADRKQSYTLAVRNEFGAGQLEGLDNINVNVTGATEFLGLNGVMVPFNNQISKWKVIKTSTGYELNYSDNPAKGIGRTLAHLFATTSVPIVIYVEKPGDFTNSFKRESDRLGMLTFTTDDMPAMEQHFMTAFAACEFDQAAKQAPAAFIDVTQARWGIEFDPDKLNRHAWAFVSDWDFDNTLEVWCDKETGLETRYNFAKARNGDPLTSVSSGPGTYVDLYAVASFESQAGGNRQLAWTKARLIDGENEWNVIIEGPNLAREFQAARGNIEIGLSTIDPAAGKIDLVGIARFGSSGAREAIGKVLSICKEKGFDPDKVSPAKTGADTGNSTGGEPAASSQETQTNNQAADTQAPEEPSTERWVFIPASSDYSARAKVYAKAKTEMAELGVICNKSKDLVTYYSIPIADLDKQIDPSSTVYPAFWVDTPKSGFAPSPRWFEYRLRKIVDTWGAFYVGDALPKLMINAKRNVDFGISPTDPVNREFQVYNVTKFSVAGSTAAIKSVIAACKK